MNLLNIVQSLDLTQEKQEVLDSWLTEQKKEIIAGREPCWTIQYEPLRPRYNLYGFDALAAEFSEREWENVY